MPIVPAPATAAAVRKRRRERPVAEDEPTASTAMSPQSATDVNQVWSTDDRAAKPE
jgi:hypothetical protein